jgi:hypothetical protein
MRFGIEPPYEVEGNPIGLPCERGGAMIQPAIENKYGFNMQVSARAMAGPCWLFGVDDLLRSESSLIRPIKELRRVDSTRSGRTTATESCRTSVSHMSVIKLITSDARRL